MFWATVPISTASPGSTVAASSAIAPNSCAFFATFVNPPFIAPKSTSEVASISPISLFKPPILFFVEAITFFKVFKTLGH